MKPERSWFARVRLGNLGLTTLALALMVPDVGHAGYLFAAREAGGREWIGYLLALCVDATFAVAFREIGRVRQIGRRLYAIAVALLACTVNGGFNVGYYRDTAARDPLWLSLMLGASAPVLAALLSVMQAFEQVDVAEQEETTVDREAERAAKLELEKYRIAQEVEVKRIRAQAKLVTVQRDAQAKAMLEQARETETQAMARQAQLVETLGSLRAELRTLRAVIGNPDASQMQIAEIAGCSRRTVANHMRRLEQAGIIRKNGNGIEVLVSQAVTNAAQEEG